MSTTLNEKQSTKMVAEMYGDVPLNIPDTPALMDALRMIANQPTQSKREQHREAFVRGLSFASAANDQRLEAVIDAFLAEYDGVIEAARTAAREVAEKSAESHRKNLVAENERKYGVQLRDIQTRQFDLCSREKAISKREQELASQFADDNAFVSNLMDRYGLISRGWDGSIRERKTVSPVQTWVFECALANHKGQSFPPLILDKSPKEEASR